MDDSPLRLMIYDDTCRRDVGPVGLTHTWMAGRWLYRGLGRLDVVRGVSSWPKALDWLARVARPRPIAEIQFWGHGKWGQLLIDGIPLDRSSLHEYHPHHDRLLAIRERLTDDALWWFRTCETFGAELGHRFARAWTSFFDCRAAGHTYIIGPWQSGLHHLAPGDEPHWSPWEGLAEGTPDEPVRAEWSTWRKPCTVTCLHNTVPREW